MGQALPQEVGLSFTCLLPFAHTNPRWFGPSNGNNTFSEADFDALIGHSTAVIDAVAAVFATELIEAYPNAKVVLNCHSNIDVWHQSCKVTLVAPWYTFFMAWLYPGCFWAWHLFVRFLWPGLFRALDGDMKNGVERNGKWVAKGKFHSVCDGTGHMLIKRF